MYIIIVAWISSVKQQFFSAKNAKAVSVLLRFPCEISQEKSWDFPRIPENHSQEFPENYFALICTNIPENSREFSGLYWNRNGLKTSQEFLRIKLILGILGNSREQEH